MRQEPQPESRPIYEFGPFRLDPDDRLLWRNHEIVPLTPKAIEMLLLFVESGGRVLSKEDLMARLWPDTFVEEANLSHQVYKLRDALGSDASYIETIARRGYRFSVTVKRRIEATPLAIVEREPVAVVAAVGTPATAPVLAFPGAAPSQPAPSPSALSWRLILPWAVAAALGIAVIWQWAWPRSSAVQSSPVHLAIELATTGSIVPANGASVVLSPDGGTIAFRGRAQAEAKPQIFIRRLDQNSATPLPGTEGVWEMFFSPNGLWIGFAADGKLKKVPVAGGDVITLCDVGLFRGGDWTEDGHIVFASSSRTGLSRVVDGGGEVEQVTTLNAAAGEITHRYPQVLPGGRTVMFTSHTNSVNYDDASIVAQPLDGGPTKLLLRGGYAARYVASGHLLYVRNFSVMAVPFDLERLAVTGTPFPVVERVEAVVGSAGAQFSVAKNGTLIYLQGTGLSAPLVMLDVAGRRDVIQAPGPYRAPRFSPDGRRLALQGSDDGRSRIWLFDLARAVMSRLTADSSADEVLPMWMPDGRRIVFSSDRDARGEPHLFWKQVDTSDLPVRLTDLPRSEQEVAGSLLSDGKTLVFSGLNERSGTYADILKVSVHADEGAPLPAPVPLLNGSYGESHPAVSPDGRWLAYGSAETGQAEVFVRRFPELDIKTQVSADGGAQPTWSPSTNELFFASADHSTIMVVSYTPDDAIFHAGKPHVWGSARLVDSGPVRNFDVHPDGKHIVIVEAPEGVPSVGEQKAFVYFNVFDELRKLASSRR